MFNLLSLQFVKKYCNMNPLTQIKEPKKKIRNWREYNASLCKRGSLYIFFDSQIVAEWLEISKKKKIVGKYVQKHDLKRWKTEHKYHKRTLNETVMFRFKTIFGDKLDARVMENQKTEIPLKCLILNKFTGIGMPNYSKIA